MKSVSDEQLSDALKYAPVLKRMVEITGAEGNEKVSFGEAMDRAQSELHLEVPEHMRGHMLKRAFQIIVNGKIPGAPDA